MSKHLEKNAQKKELLSKPAKPDISRRELDRIDIWEGDGVTAGIQFLDSDKLYAAKVLDLSFSGVKLTIPRELRDKFIKFASYPIIIKRAGEQDLQREYVCVWIQPDNEEQEFHVGFRVKKQKSFTELVSEDGDDKTIKLSNAAPVNGYIYKDIFYCERSSVNFVAISRNKVVFEVNETQQFLHPGMKFDILISLQSSSGDNLPVEVIDVFVKNKKNIVVIAKILKITKNLESDLVAHIMYDQRITPEMVRKAGFLVQRVSNNFRFRYVKTQQDYIEALKLRSLAYKAANKVDQDRHYEDMAAPLDHMSRILVAYHGDRMVASVALSFPDNEEIVIDVQRSLVGDFPEDLPKKTDLIEVSRLCTHPEYRKCDLLLRMFEQIYRVFLASDRSYLITSTDKKLWPIYKGIGFKKSKYTYDHPTLNKIPHTIITVPKRLGSHAEGIGILRWNYLYKNMTEHMDGKITLNHSPVDLFKIFLFKWIGKIFRITPKKNY